MATAKKVATKVATKPAVRARKAPLKAASKTSKTVTIPPAVDDELGCFGTSSSGPPTAGPARS